MNWNLNFSLHDFEINIMRSPIVSETHVAGTSVSVVARRHDINANLLFRWRDDPRYAFQKQSFLPVEISPAVQDRDTKISDLDKLTPWNYVKEG